MSERLQPLLIDVSPWQRDTIQSFAWSRLAADPAYAGVILKAGEGLRDTGVWLRGHADAVRATRLDLGYYWYLRLDALGAAQADAFARVLDREPGTLRCIVDVEEGSGNDNIVSARGAGVLAEAVHTFAERIAQRTGLAPILYAGGWARSLRIGRCGCAALWIAAYTARLPAAWTTAMGFAPHELWAWQYAGASGRGMLAELAGYPHTTPIGDADISAVVMRDGLERMRWVERPGG